MRHVGISKQQKCANCFEIRAADREEAWVTANGEKRMSRRHHLHDVSGTKDATGRGSDMSHIGGLVITSRK